MVSLNLDSKLSRLVLWFSFIAIPPLVIDTTLWCWRINFQAEMIYFCSWSRGWRLSVLCIVNDNIEVSLRQAFAFILPWITVKNSCGMGVQATSQSNKVAVIMLTDSFSQCCADVSDTSSNICQTAFSLQVTKIKENKVIAVITFYPDLYSP